MERQQANSATISQNSRQHADPSVLPPATLASLPDELHAELQEAVESADIEMTKNLIKQFRQQDEPLAESLEELMKGYRFDTLQVLFREDLV